jgi:hypothetical protein
VETLNFADAASFRSCNFAAIASQSELAMFLFDDIAARQFEFALSPSRTHVNGAPVYPARNPTCKRNMPKPLRTFVDMAKASGGAT